MGNFSSWYFWNFGASFDQFMVQLASVGIVGVFCVIGATLFTLLVKSIIGQEYLMKKRNWFRYI